VSRILVVHWKPEEAESGLALLRRAGHEVEVYADRGGVGLAKYKQEVPEVVLVSLERLPSHGRHFAHCFRTTKATAQVPIVFVGGVEEKVAIAREMLPDAICCSWRGVRGAVTRALKIKQTQAPQPGAAHDKALWQKLEIRAGDRVLQLGGPEDLLPLLGEGLPTDVELLATDDPDIGDLGPADLVLLFAQLLQDIKQWFPQAAALTPDKRQLWICWPKKSSGVDTNVTQAAVMAYARASGWADFKICRVDDTWSGHMLRRRRNPLGKGS